MYSAGLYIHTPGPRISYDIIYRRLRIGRDAKPTIHGNLYENTSTVEHNWCK